MLPLEKVAFKRVRATGDTMDSQKDASEATMKAARTQHIRQFRGSFSRGAWEILMTVLVHSLVVALHGSLWYPAWIVVQGLCLIRWFMIFHDCGHGSFFPTNSANNYLLWVTSWLVWTPVKWSTTHRLHHANHGNLDGNFRWSDTILFTKKQFDSAATSIQLAYRFFRHKLFFFTVAPVANWCIKHRIPINTKHHTALDNMLNTAGVAAILFGLRAAYGTSFMLDWVYGILIGACFGFILFHAQHSFEDGYARRQKQWYICDHSTWRCKCAIPSLLCSFVTMEVKGSTNSMHPCGSKMPCVPATQNCSHDMSLLYR
eukprot:m.206412 g.206412  ORF g.206412 m.206412 type:complete len:316 (-) comp18902_c0_seq1:703-1650(-)